MMPWQQVLRESLRTQKQLEDFFQSPFPHTPYSLSIPLRIARKIKEQGLQGPLGLQYLPRREERKKSHGFQDPTGDQLRRSEEGIIHRYTNRILISPTPLCPVQCRYCFRKNNLKDNAQNYKNSPRTMNRYLLDHPEVNEIIFTGGDPLMISDSLLCEYLRVIAKFPHIQFVRLHTRTPLTIPERLTPSLIKLLEQFHHQSAQVHLVVHINHWSEVDRDILQVFREYRRAHLPILSQSVLLKGVNDQTESLYELFFNLATHHIRPYYLHHPDPTKGAMHFFLSLEEGQKIYYPLRQKLPGWVLPHYVVDDIKGRGKTLVGNDT